MRIERLEELKAEQNNFHQQQILDEIIMYDGLEMSVGMIIYTMELMLNELTEQNKSACDKVVELANRLEQHDRILKLMKDVLDNRNE